MEFAFIFIISGALIAISIAKDYFIHKYGTKHGLRDYYEEKKQNTNTKNTNLDKNNLKDLDTEIEAPKIETPKTRSTKPNYNQNLLKDKNQCIN